MRWAIPASLTIHLGLIAGAWLMMQWEPEDLSTAEAAVSIDIISMEDTVTEPSETVSEATANLVSAGMTQSAAEPIETEAGEPVDVAEAQPVEPAATQPATAAAVVPVTETIASAKAEALVSAEVMTALTEVEAPITAPVPQVTDDSAPIVAEAVAPSDAEILERLDQTARLAELEPTPEAQEITTASISPLDPAKPVESPEPVKVANLNPMPEAIIEEVVETPPVPAPRIVRKPVEAEKKPVEDKKPAEKKKAEKPAEKKKTKQEASLGNGGEAEADSAASKAAGGKPGKVSIEGGNSAAYAGKVRAKVIKALKRPSGSYDPGEARVTFTIDASGRLVSVRISGSSGDAKVDKAVVAAVERAAPFPSFTDGGPRAFTFPLMIQ
jgi:protein TonB